MLLVEPMTSHFFSDVVYHYTSFEALKNIVSSRSIWATESKFLNDQSEIKYAIHLTLDHLKGIYERTSSREIKETISLLSKLTDRFFVSSFCSGGDILSQWRGYCKAGNGYSIGFSVHKMKQIAKKKGWFFNPVEYRESHQINDIIDVALRDAAIENPSNNPKRYALLFMKKFGPYLAFIKHPSFYEEGEWRLVAVLSSGKSHYIHFRQNRSKRLPYLSFDFRTAGLPIQKITLSPSTNSKSRLSQLKALCLSNKIQVTLSNSIIPFRQ